MADKGDSTDRPRILVDRVTGEPLPEGILLAPGRQPDDPVRVDRRPRVSDDTGALERVRQLWQRAIDELYTAALQAVRSNQFIYQEHLLALRRRRERAVADLLAILGEGQGDEAARARAAHALIELGAPAGEQFLLGALESGSAETRKAALAMLRQWGVQVDLTGEERARRVLAQFDHPDPEVVAAAVELCARRRVPGAEARMVALLHSGAAANPQRVAGGLAHIATTPEAVQAMLPHLFQLPQGHYQGHSFYLDRLLGHPDPAVAEPVRRALHAHTRGLTGELRHQQHVVRDLALTADEEAIPVLEEIRDNASDPASRLYALEALARLQPGRAVDLALDFMARHGRYQMVIDILSARATEHDADRLIAAVVPPADGEARQLNQSVVRLLLERLGEKGRQVVAERLADVEPAARMEAVWALRGLSLPAALSELQAAGVIEESPQGGSGPSGLLNALGESGLVTAFDTETGMVPCRHDRLIRSFAEGTAGRFTPECAVEVWHQKDEDDYNAPYSVAFIYRGRLYSFAAENYGDYYDVQAVVDALNFALADLGHKERFLGVDGMGQCAFYVFADPALFLPIAEKYGVPVSADASGPMRAGREFEQQVFGRHQEG